MKRSRSSIPLLSDFRGTRNNWNAPKLENSRAKNISARAGTFDGYEEAWSRRERGEVRVYCPPMKQTRAKKPMRGCRLSCKMSEKRLGRFRQKSGITKVSARPEHSLVKNFFPLPLSIYDDGIPSTLSDYIANNREALATFVVSSQSWKIRTIIPDDGSTFALN